MTRLSLLTALGALSVACSSNSLGVDAGSTAGSTAGGLADTGPTAPPPPTAQLRFAQLAPSTAALDVCAAIHGTGNFAGPLLGSVGLSGGLTFGDVSLPFGVQVTAPLGQVDLRLVPAGQGCAAGLPGLADFTALPPLAANASYTAAIVRQGGGPDLVIFPDDARGVVAAGQSALRVIDADVAGPATIDVTVTEGGGAAVGVHGLPPLGIPQGSGVDGNGYLDLPASSVALISIASGGVDLLDLLTSPMVGLRLGAAQQYTLFALPGTAGLISALLCDDTGNAVNGYTPCGLFPQPGLPLTVSGGSATTSTGGAASTGATSSGTTAGVTSTSSSGSSSTGGTTGNSSSSGASTSGGMTGGGSSGGGTSGGTTGAPACGGQGESCCAKTSCNAGLGCVCTGGNPLCGQEGTCQACGGTGQPCCSTGPECSAGNGCACSPPSCPGSAVVVGTCQAPCGGGNSLTSGSEPCCVGQTCAANLACASTGNLCVCGYNGTPCCNGTDCGGGLTCRSGSCAL